MSASTSLPPTTINPSPPAPVVPTATDVQETSAGQPIETLTPVPESVDPASQISVRVDELITGRKLEFPIHDESGILLLAAGMPVSADVKRTLKSRGFENVNLNKSDAAKATLNLNTNLQAASYFPTLDPEISKKLDQVMDTGMLRVSNHGPSVQESVVNHGQTAYSSETKERLITQHQQTCTSMDNMMQEAMSGKQVSGNQVARCAAGFLSNLIEDRDASISLAKELKDDNALADHSLKMALLGMALAIEMEFDSDNVRKLGVTALVQDWGMVSVPKEIREAKRALTDLETLEIHKHPIHTVNMLQRVLGLPDITSLVAYQIHERPDGSGYPRSRDDKTIHPFAKILNVAHEYLTLIDGFGDQKPLMPYSAMECLLRMAQRKKVDPIVVRALLKVQSLFPIGSYVALSDGSVAQVMRRNIGNYTQPFVRRVMDENGQPVSIDDNAEFLNLEQAGLAITQAIPTPGREELPFDPAMLENWK